METNKFKVIGIIGGVGPWAAIDFERKLLETVGAKTDQGNPVIINFNNSQIPDRTKALLHGGPSPVPELVRTAQKLVTAGAEVICVPCNTAHAFLPAVLKESRLEEYKGVVFVNMVDEVVAKLSSNPFRSAALGVKNIGILATTGTIKSGVYDKALTRKGYKPMHVTEALQRDNVMEAIYGETGIKSGAKADGARNTRLLEEAADYLAAQGSHVILAVCTEIPLALKRARVPLVDGNQVLADAVIRTARIK